MSINAFNNVVMLTMISDGKIKFICVTVITTYEKLCKAYLKDKSSQ